MNPEAPNPAHVGSDEQSDSVIERTLGGALKRLQSAMEGARSKQVPEDVRKTAAEHIAYALRELQISLLTNGVLAAGAVGAGAGFVSAGPIGAGVVGTFAAGSTAVFATHIIGSLAIIAENWNGPSKDN